MTTPRVAIYARQSVEEDQGIRQQVEDCRAEAERRGWTVLAEYEDNDTSGSKERGSDTAWAEMLRAYDCGEIDTLIVNDVDRLTRSLNDVLQVRPPQRDMRIVVVRGGIDTEEGDDYFLKFLVLIAEREVKIKTIRAQRYALERRKAGHPSAGMTPHGYRWVREADRDEQGTRYEVNEDEAQDVRRIFSEYLAGAPLGQIARDLNADGSRTRRGAKWITSTVRRILLNPLYAAKLPPAQPSGKHDLRAISLEECANGAWEPIISFDELTATRGQLLNVKPNHNGTARKWLLSGLAICGICDTPVRSARGETHPTARKDGSGKAPSKRYHAYRCTEGHFMRNGDIIDQYVSEVCIARLSQPDALALLTSRNDTPDIAVLHTTRNELEDRYELIASLIAAGKMKPEAAEQALEDLAAELEHVNDAIGRLVTRDPLAELAGVEDVRQWWEEATLARRRAVVETLMTVSIQRVGHGRRVTTLEGAADTVDIQWHKPK
jgi:DNA invertase Pin-like site-specific DNA recombinase